MQRSQFLICFSKRKKIKSFTGGNGLEWNIRKHFLKRFPKFLLNTLKKTYFTTNYHLSRIYSKANLLGYLLCNIKTLNCLCIRFPLIITRLNEATIKISAHQLNLKQHPKGESFVPLKITAKFFMTSKWMIFHCPEYICYETWIRTKRTTIFVSSSLPQYMYFNTGPSNIGKTLRLIQYS